VVDCSIEHLINIVFEGISGTPMCISQHQHLDLIPRSVLRVCAIPDKCFPVLKSAKRTVTVKLVKVDISIFK